jgi:hypothetical protein
VALAAGGGLEDGEQQKQQSGQQLQVMFYHIVTNMEHDAIPNNSERELQ